MIYRFRDCELDTARFELRRNGAVQSVEPQVFRLLAHLIENRHRVVTRAELYDAVWDGRIVAEAALYSRIKSARSAIGDEGQAQAQIRTVSRTGYQFVAEIEEPTVNGSAHDAAVHGHRAAATAAEATAPAASPANASRKRLVGILAGVAAALAAGYLLTRPDPAPADPRTAAKPAVPSIAVLPFLDMSPAKDQEYFADGLTEELTDHMSRIPGLRVVARTSSFAFKGKHEDLREVASKLSVQNLLEGSVRRDGENLRITAQLIDANGKHIWSQTYDRKREDIFAIQNDVSKSVAAVLSVTVDPKPLDASRGGTRNVEAYDAYLAARAALVDPTFAWPDKLAYGIEQFRRATTLDPDFAYAWAWLAITYYRSVVLPARGYSDWNTEASQAAARARKLAPDEPTTLVAAALAAMQAGEWAEAEGLFALARARASTENPWACSGCFALNVGRARDAEEFMRRAKENEPLMTANSIGLATAYEWQGNLEGAETELAYTAGLPAGEWLVPYRLLTIAMIRRDRPQFEQRVAQLPRDDKWNRMMASYFDTPQAALAELRRAINGTPPAGWNIGWRIYPAQWAAFYGDPHLALEFMRPVMKDATLGRSVWMPILTSMRQLPEFKDIVREAKLLEYWRTTGKWGDFCKPIGTDDFECR